MNLSGPPGAINSLFNVAPNDSDEQESTPEASEPQGQLVSFWSQLAQQPLEDVLLPFLLQEHPQTITVILSNFPSDVSAKVVSQLPDELSGDLMRRLLSLKQIHNEVLAILEDSLREQILSDEQASGTNAAHSQIANMINRMDGEQRQRIIDNISATSPEEAEAIKRLLFSFEDIEKLSEAACQILFGEVPTEMTIMSLQGWTDHSEKRSFRPFQPALAGWSKRS